MAGYAGDITPGQAWDILASQPMSVLIDVRTQPEWSFVGVPDLSALAKEPRLISWLLYPDMRANEKFSAEVQALGTAPEVPLLFLCRSGARSRAAAEAMTARGYKVCYNIAGGFEGDPDTERHRGKMNGWKASQLPWVQS